MGIFVVVILADVFIALAIFLADNNLELADGVSSLYSVSANFPVNALNNTGLPR